MLRVKSWKRMVLIRRNSSGVVTQVDGLPFNTTWVTLERLATIKITLIHTSRKIVWWIEQNWIWRESKVIWEVRSEHNISISKQLIASLMLTFYSIVIVRYWWMLAFKIFNTVEAWSLNGFSDSNYSLNTVAWDRIFVPYWRKADFFFRILVRQSPNNLA